MVRIITVDIKRRRYIRTYESINDVDVISVVEYVLLNRRFLENSTTQCSP